MSTPTTAAAAAALPHYAPHHHHHHHLQNHFAKPYTHQYSSSGSYRATASSNMIPPISPPYSTTTQLAYTISTQSAPRPLSSGTSWTDAQRAPDMMPAPSQPTLATTTASTHHPPAAPVALVAPAAPAPQPSRRAAVPPPAKRRRSKGPDWEKFYKNGLPTEVIVIEDTPEPEVAAAQAASYANPTTAHGVSNLSPATNSAKKRKREDDATVAYDPVYGTRPRVSQANSSHHPPSTGSGSTVSHDGASVHVPSTSLSSSATYDDAQQGQRRKRARRTTDGNKESELLEDSLLLPYRPPELPPKKASEVSVRIVREPRAHKHIKVDDDDGHYIVIADSDLTEHYKIIKVLGQGTFGKVVQAKDRRRNKLVAIKIIRSVQKYRDASRIELRVLQTLKLNDEENRNRCIHLRDCFDFRGHICIVMDLLGQSVFDFLRSTHFVPFPNSHIQSFARQLLTSVAYLHDVNLIHTDLKPENILLCEDAYQTFTYNRRIPSSSQTVSRTSTQRRVLLNPEIRLIDFGSATFQDEYHSMVVSTRHYRAPEIILGLGWSYPCDIWSIGCILVEFFTGDALFQTHDNLEHLAMMEAVVGSRIDSHLVAAVHRLTPSRSTGNSPAKYFKRSLLDYPNKETGRVSKKFVKAMKPLEEIVPCTTTFQKQFLDLLRKIFVYDPAKRITAKQALQHPWFREMPIPDDGTEAAKIRQHRHELNPHSLID